MNRVSAVALCVFLWGCGGKEGPTGPAGAKGEAGQPGGVGPQGAPGSNEVAVSMTCGKIVASTLFTYKTATYTNGDKWVACSIKDTVAEYGASTLYKRTASGATDGMCLVGYDVDVASGGYWTFTAGASVVGTYHDSGSASNNSTVTYAPSDCASAP